jgi:tetratricopeptide (TPR) repeat protein
MEDRRAMADQAYNLGLESYRKGNWAEAMKFWEEVLRYVPGHAQAKRNLDRLRLEHVEINTVKK